MKELVSLPPLGSPGATYEFLQSYIQELKKRNYAGSVIMHGLGEEEVAFVQGMLVGLIGQTRGSA